MDRISAICRQRDVTCLDLRATFSGVRPVERLWANRLDSHPGSVANRLAADAVLRNFGGSWGLH